MFADFNLEVTRPWLLIGLAIVLPWLLLYFFRSLVDFARWQRIASLVMRFAIAILLALALAGLTMLTPTDRQYIVVAIDDSFTDPFHAGVKHFHFDMPKGLGNNQHTADREYRTQCNQVVLHKYTEQSAGTGESTADGNDSQYFGIFAEQCTMWPF